MRKTWTFPYQDPIEGENIGWYKCTNGISKVKRKISNFKLYKSSKTR